MGWRTRGHPQRPSSSPTQWWEVPSEARRRGGPRRAKREPGAGEARAVRDGRRPAWRSPPPSCPSAAGGSATAAAPSLTFVIPERRPSGAKDGVSGIHASPSIPAIRYTTRHVPPVVAAAPRSWSSSRSPPYPPASRPPSVVSSRRHLRPHCVGWRTRSHPQRPSSNPTQWGGGAERSEAEGGTTPDQSGNRTGLPRPTWPLPVRHPGTASERSAGRRIRDPCLAVHPRDPVHDEALPPVVAAAPRSWPSSRPSPYPPASHPPSVVASRRHLRPHCVGWRTRGHPQRPSSYPAKWEEVPSEARRRGGTGAGNADPAQARSVTPRGRRSRRGLRVPACRRRAPRASRGRPALPPVRDWPAASRRPVRPRS